MRSARELPCDLGHRLMERVAMPRTRTDHQALTVSQLALRWGISRDHARQLILAGLVPGAFTIPRLAGPLPETSS
jgi:hypothetical protein